MRRHLAACKTIRNTVVNKAKRHDCWNCSIYIDCLMKFILPQTFLIYLERKPTFGLRLLCSYLELPAEKINQVVVCNTICNLIYIRKYHWSQTMHVILPVDFYAKECIWSLAQILRKCCLISVYIQWLCIREWLNGCKHENNYLYLH